MMSDRIMAKPIWMPKAPRMNQPFVPPSCLVAAYLIERILFNDSIVMTAIVSALAGACELWSFSASILIIHPEFPFIRLFRKYLKGEIENKIGITLNELEKQAGKAEKENTNRPKQETECFGDYTDI